MKELAAIVEAYNEATRQGLRTALATVVEVIGSSYRSAGARMLVAEDGKITGAISGGCLEGDALKKALYAIENKAKRIVVYDTTDESDAAMGIQLGCNGTVYILFEPIDSEVENNPIHLIQHAIKFRHNSALVTVFSKDLNAAQTGTSLAVNCDGIIGINKLADDAKMALLKGESVFKNIDNDTAFIEIIQPPISLVIIGAGNDVMPLAAMAAELGWEISVVDGRPGCATQKRFPDARVVKTSPAENVFADMVIDSRTAVLLMSHNYNYDLKVLQQAVEKDSFYIGLLGPKDKRNKMVAELHGGAEVSKIHGPMGLDIGAENAAEIALSVLAEIQAALHKKNALPLRDKLKPIHSKDKYEAA